MNEASCFHDLRESGVVRELAAGVTARVFGGVEHHVRAVSATRASAADRRAPEAGATIGG